MHPIFAQMDEDKGQRTYTGFYAVHRFLLRVSSVADESTDTDRRIYEKGTDIDRNCGESGFSQ